jgi:type IV secretory pathway VirB3-like protein
MTTGPTLHLVHKAVNRPLLIFQVERRMLGGVFVLFFAVMFLTRSFPISLLVGGSLYVAARRITAREPQWLLIRARALGRPQRFDAGAGKHRRFDVEIRS